MRIKSVRNIGKITSAMKMVSTAKYKHDERRFKAGMPFATPVINFMERKIFWILSSCSFLEVSSNFLQRKMFPTVCERVRRSWS